MRKTVIIGAALAFFAGCHEPDKNIKRDFLADDIDSTINPADDFFSYANGGWIKKNPIPADQSSWGIGHLVRLDIYNRLRIINEKAAAEPAKEGSIAQKIGDFWISGMDSAAIEKQGLSPLQPDLLKIEQIANLSDLVRVAAELGTRGVDAMFAAAIQQDERNSDQMALHIWQGGLGMPDRNYYFNTDENTVAVREAYHTYQTKSFRTLGKDSLAASEAAMQVYQLESRLAKASRKMEDLRDPDLNYFKKDFASMQKSYPKVAWSEFIKNSGILIRPDSLIVGQPEFLTALNNALTSTSLVVWKNYLSFHLLNSAAPYLNQSVFMDRFNYRKTLSGVQMPKPRWKAVLDAEGDAIGEALGELFVKEYFPAKSKLRYINMVEAMREAYNERISQLSWMSDSTKKRAQLKLARITKKVGYPDKWRDFTSLIIDKGPWILNVQRAAQWWNNEQVKKLGKPVDRTEWEMTPQTYNAYYNPANNEIVLPAGMFMVPGERDEDLDDAFVYGYTAASTIGHEMTHGFDDQGRKFDEAGNLRDWWLPDDSKSFKESAGKIVRQFNDFVPVDTLHVNGAATQGENIADLGGLVIGWDAFSKTAAFKNQEKIGGLTPASSFLSSV